MSTYGCDVREPDDGTVPVCVGGGDDEVCESTQDEERCVSVLPGMVARERGIGDGRADSRELANVTAPTGKESVSYI